MPEQYVRRCHTAVVTWPRCLTGSSSAGAREHNLQNVTIDLPRDKLIVFTGLSGSGKSSLAFDTIYAEGQRRYVESLSAYARQFLGQMDKPDVDFIDGLSPAISIDQKSASRNPRSTVGTITEVYDYLRLLFARIGIPHCPNDGTVVQRQSPQQIVDRILELPEGTRFQVLAPVVRGRKGEYEGLLDDLAAQGFTRARVDGEMVDLAEPGRRQAGPLREPHDRDRRRPARRAATASSAASPTRWRRRCGWPRAWPRSRSSPRDGEDDRGRDRSPSASTSRAPSAACRSRSWRRATSRSTRPTAPARTCSGLGTTFEVDPELVVPDPDLSIDEGAITPWKRPDRRVLPAPARGRGRELRLLSPTRRGRS